jgi:hypothetical protein
MDKIIERKFKFFFNILNSNYFCYIKIFTIYQSQLLLKIQVNQLLFLNSSKFLIKNIYKYKANYHNFNTKKFIGKYGLAFLYIYES